jgi:hypothetical protein
MGGAVAILLRYGTLHHSIAAILAIAAAAYSANLAEAKRQATRMPASLVFRGG